MESYHSKKDKFENWRRENVLKEQKMEQEKANNPKALDFVESCLLRSRCRRTDLNKFVAVAGLELL